MYTSTRQNKVISTSKAILEGLSEDGGLYVLKDIKKLILSPTLVNASYLEIAKKVFLAWMPEFSEIEVMSILGSAYATTNFPNHIANIAYERDFAVLELFHGPTFAFKDIALSAMPFMLDIAKLKENTLKRSIILTATSGDTGGATLSGFNNRDDVVIVLYPDQHVSAFQKMQMLQYVGKNRYVVAINGHFDDCQKIVKDAFNYIKTDHVLLKTSNSINIARIIPQIVYYVFSYMQLVQKQQIKLGEFINYVIPSGNFGNALACYYAKKMGLPIHKIIIGSNQNNTLTDFFKTGLYDVRRPFIKTISPSMDILIASNIERLLYDVCSENTEVISSYMQKLKQQGVFEIDATSFQKLSLFYAVDATDQQTEDMIKKTYQTSQLLIDPHTAVAMHAYEHYKMHTSDYRKTIIVSTASPFKFADVILKAIDQAVSSDYKKNIESLSSFSKSNFDSRIPFVFTHQNTDLLWERKDALIKLKRLVGNLDVNR